MGRGICTFSLNLSKGLINIRPDIRISQETRNFKHHTCYTGSVSFLGGLHNLSAFILHRDNH